MIRPSLATLCVSKETCSRGLARRSSSKIHWRAAPMPRVGDVVLESVLRVPNAASVLTSSPSLASDTADDQLFESRVGIERRCRLAEHRLREERKRREQERAVRCNLMVVPGVRIGPFTPSTRE